MALTKSQYVDPRVKAAQAAYEAEYQQKLAAARRAYQQALNTYNTQFGIQKSSYEQALNRALQNYQNEYASKKTAYQQALENQLAAYNKQRANIENVYTQSAGRVREEKEQQLPVFARQRDAADVQGYRNVERLREMLAGLGLYKSGEMGTGAERIMSQAAGNVQQGFNAENQYLRDVTNRLAELEAQRSQGISNVEDAIALANRQTAQNLQSLDSWLASQRTAQQREYEDNLRALNEWLASQRAGTEQSWTQQQQDLADWMAAQNRAAQLKAEAEYLEYLEAMRNAARRSSGGGSGGTYIASSPQQDDQTFQAAYDAVFKSGGDYRQNFNKIARQVYQIGGEKTYNRLKNAVEQADRQKRKNYIDQNPYLYQYMLKYGPGGVL